MPLVITEKDYLQVIITEEQYTYILNGKEVEGVPKIAAGSIVEFTNNCVDTVYIDSVDAMACPFTEAWPTCIPLNATVYRKVWDAKIEAPLSFPFHTYDLVPKGITSGENSDFAAISRVGQPEGNGDIVIH